MRYEIKKIVNGEDRATVYRPTEELAVMFVKSEYRKQKEQNALCELIPMNGTMIMSNCMEATVVCKYPSDGHVETISWKVTPVREKPEIAFPEVLYHVTDLQRLQLILQQGLKPGNGENCIMTSEKNKGCLFLCGLQDVPYWSILLGKDKVVRVNTTRLNEEDFEYFNYGKYGEWFTKKPIGFEYTNLSSMFIPKTDPMNELCEGYVFTLSDLIVFMTKVGTYPDGYANAVKRITHDANSILNVMENRLDFSYISDLYICNKLEQYGDEGEYTMCDMYCVGERISQNMLWEQLILFDFEHYQLKPMKETYQRVHDFVRDNFKWVYKVSSGGYTG